MNNLITSNTLQEQVRRELAWFFGRRDMNGDVIYIKEKRCYAFDTMLGPKFVMWRWRTASKYSADSFTIRNKHPNNKEQELRRIMEGEFDFLFYCQQKDNILIDYILIDLNILRPLIIQKPGQYLPPEENNYPFDGTSYHEFFISTLPSIAIISDMDTVQKARNPAFWHTRPETAESYTL
jgi:hypothetical protein